MKKLVMMLGVALALTTFAGTQFEVKNVEAHQRYPWNGKVDIDFLLDSSDPSATYTVTVACTDHDRNTDIPMKSVKLNDKDLASTEFILKKGQYRLVWDADVDSPNVRLPNVSFAITAKLVGEDRFLVIDLSGGPAATKYPVSYRNDIPSGGWTDEYKTTKLVMRKCSDSSVGTFFAGVFEVTQKQWALVMNSDPSYFKGDARPVESVSFDACSSFVSTLRLKAGLNALGLPTAQQWECACRAETTTTYSYGNSANGDYMWYSANSGSQSHDVGTKLPNPWGLYDMHGNVWEWTEAASGSYRNSRGGGWFSGSVNCTSSYRDNYCSSSNTDNDLGFRLFLTW